MHRVIGGESTLHGCKVRKWIFLERDEEQTGIKLAGDGINPFGIAVTTPQHSNPTVGPWTCHTNVRAHRDDGKAVRLRSDEIRNVMFSTSRQRSP